MQPFHGEWRSAAQSRGAHVSQLLPKDLLLEKHGAAKMAILGAIF